MKDKTKNQGLFPFQPSQNGLYPATTSKQNPDMQYFWIRDNYWIYKSGISQQSIGEAFATIVRKHEHKIKCTINSRPCHEWEYIHPRYSENLEELDGEWGWIQNDCVGNLLEVLTLEGFEDEAELVFRYIKENNLYGVEGYGFWEDEKKIHGSSLAALYRGVSCFQPQGWERVKYQEQVMEIMRGKERVDLQDLTVLWPVQVVNDDLRKQIVYRVQEEILGEYGVKRYKGDDWNGECFEGVVEPEWPIGLAYLYLITGEERFRSRLRELRDCFGCLPESFIEGEPNCNKPLIWSEALFYKVMNS